MKNVLTVWWCYLIAGRLRFSRIFFLAFLAFSFVFTGFIPSEMKKDQPLQAVPFVDLNKYAGKWYEIASYPQSFQKGCHCTTAEYTLHEKGYVVVENRCNRDSINGPQSYIKGKAFAQKGTGNAKLKVQFFWPFRAKYWIIDLADDYSYAVVGHPNKKYLWILSRTPQMNDSTYDQILNRVEAKGFDLRMLNKTPQKI
ncbi:MAG: Outer rane lipoprotein Blc precursor [Bacteroidota bacterium]|jgi:apolipoprotein D and lipocalin family protein